MSIDKHAYPEPNSDVLINNFGIRDNEKLSKVEAEITAKSIKRIENNKINGQFDLDHLQNIHKEIFSEVYPWVGELRTIDMGKNEPILDNTTVGYAPLQNLTSYTNFSLKELRNTNFMASPENVATELANKSLEVWVAHPFRKGNTQTVGVLINEFTKSEGYNIDLHTLTKTENNETFRDSFVKAYAGDTASLTNRISEARDAYLEKETILNHPHYIQAQEIADQVIDSSELLRGSTSAQAMKEQLTGDLIKKSLNDEINLVEMSEQIIGKTIPTNSDIEL